LRKIKQLAASASLRRPSGDDQYQVAAEVQVTVRPHLEARSIPLHLLHPLPHLVGAVIAGSHQER